jgi:hypothetical protein
VQVGVTVKSLHTPLLAPAQLFAAKGCGRGDRSDGRKQTFWVAPCFRSSPCIPRFLATCSERGWHPSLGGFRLAPIKYRLSHWQTGMKVVKTRKWKSSKPVNGSCRQRRKDRNKKKSNRKSIKSDYLFDFLLSLYPMRRQLHIGITSKQTG